MFCIKNKKTGFAGVKAARGQKLVSNREQAHESQPKKKEQSGIHSESEEGEASEEHVDSREGKGRVFKAVRERQNCKIKLEAASTNPR